MLTTLLLGLLTGQAGPRPFAVARESSRFIAGVRIGRGRPSELEARLGRGFTTVRDAEPFYDGWTFWRVRGRNEWLQAYFEPGIPKSKRVITSVTLDTSDSKGHQPLGVKPSLLGFWGSIPLGVPPTALIKALGPPTQSFGTLNWTFADVTIRADLDHGLLYRIEIDSYRDL